MRKLALLVLAFLLPAAARAETAVELWRTHTLTFTTTSTVADPFGTYLLKLRLTRPNATTLDVEGFYDDADGASPYTWRVRLSPDLEGSWSWQTIAGDQSASWSTVSDGACSAGACSGTFLVQDTGDPGPLTRAGRYFQWRGSGEPVYPVGVFLDEGAIASCSGLTCFPKFSHVYASEEPTGVATLRTAMRTRHGTDASGVWHANKVNLYYANNGDYGDISTSPWTSGESATPTATTPLDLAFFTRMDQHLKDWKANGQLAFMWFFADDSSNYGTATQAAQERLIRYAMARHSAYSHTAFVLALETNETGQITTARAQALGAYTETKNPWGRLLSSHQMQSFGIGGTTIGCTAILTGEPWMDFWASQVGNNATTEQVYTCGTTIHDSHGTLPHDSEEFYQGNPGLTGQDAVGRERVWGAFLTGAASGTGSDTYNLQEFIKASRVPFHSMVPSTAPLPGGVASGYAKFQAAHHFLVYKRTTSGPISVTTTGTDLLGYWWDPTDRTSPVLSPSFAVTAGTSAYTPPVSCAVAPCQWVLWITDGTSLLGNPPRLYPDPETDTSTTTTRHVRVDGSDAQACAGGAQAGQPCTVAADCGGFPAICIGVCDGLGNAGYDGSGVGESCAKRSISEAEKLAGCDSIVQVGAGAFYESSSSANVQVTDSCSADQPKRIVGQGLTTEVFQNMVPVTCTPLVGAQRTYSCPRPSTGTTSVNGNTQQVCFLQRLPAGVHVDIEPKNGREQSLYDGWCMTPTDNGGTPILTSSGNAALDAATVAGFWTYDNSGTNDRYLIHPYVLNPDGTLPAGTTFYAPTQTSGGPLFDLAGDFASIESMRIFGSAQHIARAGIGSDGNTLTGLDVIGSGVQAWVTSDNTSPSNPSSNFFWPQRTSILNSRFRNMNRRDKNENRGLLNDPLASNSQWAEGTYCMFGGTSTLVDGVECYSACNNAKIAGSGTIIRNSTFHAGHNHNFDVGTLLNGLIEQNVTYNNQEGPFIAATVRDTTIRHNTFHGAITYNGSFNTDAIVSGAGGMQNVQLRGNAVEKILFNAPYEHCQPGYLCQDVCGDTDNPVCGDGLNCNCACPGGTSCTWTDNRAPDPSTPSTHRNIDESNSLFFRDNSDARGFFYHVRSGFSSQTMAPYLAWTGDPCSDCERGTGSTWVDGAPAAGFVNPSGVDLAGNVANYHLVAGSAAIGIGNPLYAPLRDKDGILRGSAPDAGAYEFLSTTCGNNTVESGETCDCSEGATCNGTACTDLGFSGGVIGCLGWGTPTGCTSFDTTNCTGDTTSPGAVVNLVASTASSSSCLLSWTTTGNNGNIGDLGGGQIDARVRLLSDGGINPTDGTTAQQDYDLAAQGSGEPAPLTNQPQTYLFTGLTSGLVHEFGVTILDPAGNRSAISNSPVPCTPTPTGDVTAPAAISNLAGVPLSTTSGRATWDDEGDDGAVGDFTSGALTQLRIRSNAAGCIDAGSFATATPVPGVLPPTTAGAPRSQIIGGLTPNTLYCIAVKDCDEVGLCGAISNVATFTTSASQPLTAPQNLQGASLEGGTIE
jgi:hypothetical protein